MSSTTAGIVGALLNRHSNKQLKTINWWWAKTNWRQWSIRSSRCSWKGKRLQLNWRQLVWGCAEQDSSWGIYGRSNTVLSTARARWICLWVPWRSCSKSSTLQASKNHMITIELLIWGNRLKRSWSIANRLIQIWSRLLSKRRRARRMPKTMAPSISKKAMFWRFECHQKASISKPIKSRYLTSQWKSRSWSSCFNFSKSESQHRQSMNDNSHRISCWAWLRYCKMKWLPSRMWLPEWRSNLHWCRCQNQKLKFVAPSKVKEKYIDPLVLLAAYTWATTPKHSRMVPGSSPTCHCARISWS